MINGCAPGSGAVTEWVSAPVVVDTAPLRCLTSDPAARREFTLTVQAPPLDAKDGDGKAHVSRGAMKAKIDELRAAIRRKNAVGTRALDEQDRCAAGSAVAKSSTRPAKPVTS